MGKCVEKPLVTISVNVPNLRMTKLGEKWPAFSCLERLEAGQTFWAVRYFPVLNYRTYRIGKPFWF